jgi:hypothetical protein
MQHALLGASWRLLRLRHDAALNASKKYVRYNEGVV